MNNMTELQNGNIGVGTETPTVLFDISGNIGAGNVKMSELDVDTISAAVGIDIG